MRYKDLSFETDWVELPDITLRMKEIGASPSKRPDGTEKYTLPVLRDPNTGALVTDSFDIATYLDNTYPEKPVFPRDTQSLIHAFDTVYIDLIRPAIKFLSLRAKEILKERSVEYFVTTREQNFNQELAEFSPEGPERDQHWAALEKVFAAAKMWYDKSGGKWIMRDTFCYADIITATNLLWLKRTLHDDEWKKIAVWHDRRWEKFLADVASKCGL